MKRTSTPDTIIPSPPKSRWFDRLIHFFHRPARTQKNAVLHKAFTIGGRTYYQFGDLTNQPYERAMTAIDYYEELRMCTSREFHEATYRAILENCNGKKGDVDLVAIGQLATQAMQRTQWIFTPDLLYKLSSVVFIDLERESPFTYDFKVAQEKIAHWKKHKETGAFFLQTPILELVPFLKDSEFDFQSYSKVVQAFQRSHLELISSYTSGNSNTNDSGTDLISRINKQIDLGD